VFTVYLVLIVVYIFKFTNFFFALTCACYVFMLFIHLYHFMSTGAIDTCLFKATWLDLNEWRNESISQPKHCPSTDFSLKILRSPCLVVTRSWYQLWTGTDLCGPGLGPIQQKLVTSLAVIRPIIYFIWCHHSHGRHKAAISLCCGHDSWHFSFVLWPWPFIIIIIIIN